MRFLSVRSLFFKYQISALKIRMIWLAYGKELKADVSKFRVIEDVAAVEDESRF